VIVQGVGDRLVTLSSSSSSGLELGQRTFKGAFPASYTIRDPGFNALGEGSVNLPPGVEALPGDAVLGWDFSPMRIDNLAANLFYWNGADSDGVPGFTSDDVRFGPQPGPGYRFYMRNFSYFVTGADAAVPGGPIGETDTDGSLHAHIDFFLDDGDGDSGTTPAHGMYLLSLRLRMPSLKTSLPAYLVFRTHGASIAALDNAAIPWVSDNADTLVLLGDYNKNGVVEAADYTVWRNSLGQTGFARPADGDASGTVELDDFFVWRDNYGKVSPTSGNAASLADWVVAAPEPSGLSLAILTLALLAAQFRLHRPFIET
jgi:hypothetical protein